jgi:dolichyl-phosphate-mannose-protein mannosyltransferase
MVIKSASGAAPTTQAVHAGPAPPVADDPQKEVNVTPRGQNPVGDAQALEEKIEYRDEDGNLLNEEQVAALQGKVSFSTRYETRTRLVDEQGNEVHDGVVEGQDGAPPPKLEAVEPGTGRDAGQPESSTNIEEDLRKEKSIQEAKATAEPGSDADKKTKDEL